MRYVGWVANLNLLVFLGGAAAWFFTSLLIHEGAHYIAARAMGMTVTAFKLGITRNYVTVGTDLSTVPTGDVIILLLAGPLANVITGAFLLGVLRYMSASFEASFAVVVTTVVFVLVNVTAEGSDGQRAYQLLKHPEALRSWDEGERHPNRK
tara:strand:+ start:792 stop:1247 length:456 start_codon:yes stop_codon:yes gene_type:complete